MPAILILAASLDAKTAASVERRHLSFRLLLMLAHHFRTSAEQSLRRSSFRGLLTITPIEAVYAAGSINQLLLARKKRMAGRANLDAEIAFARRTRLKSLATGAGHCYFFVFRMNSRFHFLLTLYSCHLVVSIKQAMIRVATGPRQANGPGENPSPSFIDWLTVLNPQTQFISELTTA
jgi:hypothetical protein